MLDLGVLFRHPLFQVTKRKHHRNPWRKWQSHQLETWSGVGGYGMLNELVTLVSYIYICVYIYIDTVIKSTLQKKIALQSEHGSLRRGSFCFAKGFV